MRLLETTVQGHNQFTSPTPFILLVVMAALAIFQVYCTNAGLKRCETVIIAPTFFAVFSVLTLCNTNQYYDQWNRYDATQYSLISAGILLVITGILVISASPRHAHELILDGVAAEEADTVFEPHSKDVVVKSVADDTSSMNGAPESILIAQRRAGADETESKDTSIAAATRIASRASDFSTPGEWRHRLSNGGAMNFSTTPEDAHLDVDFRLPDERSSSSSPSSDAARE
jgi:hypothetical protein